MKIYVLILALLVVAQISVVMASNWTSLVLNSNDSRYQSNFSINATNVANLTEVWQIDSGKVTSTPIVYSGNVYFADWNWSVFSANVMTGAPNWRVNTGNTISSSVCAYNGTVYVGYGLSGPIGVMAINAYDGRILWNKVLAQANKQIWASPAVYNGILYMGATGDEDTNTSTGGMVYALNAQTGNILWTFNTMPGTAGGAPVWGTIVKDPNLNAIYFGTGNAYKSASAANSLYSYSVMSLNATTGKLNWYRSIYNNLTQGADNDFGSSANLFSVRISGITYNAIGIGNKNGKYYVLDRNTGMMLENFMVESRHYYTGIISIPGFIYQGQNNPEVFIGSYYSDVQHMPGVNSTVEALYPSNGLVAWNVYTPGIVYGSISIIPGTVLFGDTAGNMYAVNISTGRTLYTKHLNYSIEGAVTPADGAILVPLIGATRGGIYAFALRNSSTNSGQNVTEWDSVEWKTVSPYSNTSRVCYNVDPAYMAVSASWCQNNRTLYQSQKKGGWKILVMNNTVYSNYDLNAQASILSGNSLRFLVDYHDTGNFYSATFSKSSNDVTFETWKNWNMTKNVVLVSGVNVSNSNVSIVGYNGSTSLFMNNELLAKINDTNYTSGQVGIATEASSVAVNNFTVQPSVPPAVALVVSGSCQYVSAPYVAVSPTWCQSGSILYQGQSSGGWKILLLNSTDYSSFYLHMNESILSGNNLRALVYYNSSGDFYSLTLSKPYNSLTFETWKNWNITNEKVLSLNSNVANGTLLGIAGYDHSVSIFMNNTLLAKINDTAYSSGQIGMATETASAVLSNVTLQSSVPQKLALDIYNSCQYVSAPYVAVSPTWCEKDGTLYQTDTSAGWKTLLLNSTGYQNFDLKLHETVLSGNTLRLLVYYNSSGNFYSIAFSKPYNSIYFETWRNWNRTSYVKVAPYANSSYVELLGYDNNISVSLNNKFVTSIGEAGYGNYSSGNIGLATDSASVEVDNLTIFSSVAAPVVAGSNIPVSDIVLFLSLAAVFGLMAILRKENGKNAKSIALDLLLTFLIVAPIAFFLFEGAFSGIFFVLYVAYLYTIYAVYTKSIKFNMKGLQKMLIILAMALILQTMIALLDWYIVQSFKGSQLIGLVGTYDNLLFFKLEPMMWLLLSLVYYLGDRRNLGTSIKIFLVGMFVTFSSIEDFLYYILSGTALPTQFPWITTVTSLFGSPLTQEKLFIWLVMMLVLAVLIILLPLQELFKKNKGK